MLARAAVDEVLEGVSVSFDENVAPRIVNAAGRSLSTTRDGALVIHGPAAFGRAKAASLGSVFTCSKDGAPHSAVDLWKSLGGFPITVKIEHTHIIDRFDTGEYIPFVVNRPPFFLLQFSGQAVASVGLDATAGGFSCELSQSYRENHRLQFEVGSIGPVPITIYLEPTLRFQVSASGQISLDQRHYFSITLEKDGFSPLSFHLAHSADPASVSANAALSASLFAGGDLSLMFGGGYGPLSIDAGVYGAFGPDFELATSTDSLGCMTATAKLEADLGVRLQLLVKRWQLELAQITSPAMDLGGPWCFASKGAGSGTPPPEEATSPEEMEAPEESNEEGAVTFPGAPLRVSVGQLGQCQSSYGEGGDNYFAPEDAVGDCGFFLAFPASGAGQIEELQDTTWGFDGTAGPRYVDSFAPVSQSSVSGSGTIADPYSQVTTFAVPASEYEGGRGQLALITETTTYVSGESQFTSTYDVKNTASQPLYFRAMYAGDLYTAGNDFGLGVYEAGPPRFVGGENPESGAKDGFIEAVGALPWTSFQEGCWNETATEDAETEEEESRCAGADPSDEGIWHAVEATVTDPTAFNESTDAAYIDNAVGVEWDQLLSKGLAPGREQAFSVINAYRP